MITPREILHQYGIRPRKKLGQSFLVDVNTIQKIAAAGRFSSDDIVVEIGAGIGVLTKDIAQVAKRVIAVEIDPQLVKILHDQFDECSNVEIHSCDILKFDISSISNNYNAKVNVIGNIPYNISSPVIFHLLSSRSAISCFTLMLQKEVVQRLVSLPDNKNYGVPSVLLQMYADIERLFDVSADCFYPRPKVESSIIQGRFREKPLFDLTDETFFRCLVKASFAQRRKMLTNNLKNAKFLEDFSVSDLKDALNSAGIDGKRRGETLSLQEFGNLSNILQQKRHKI
ncbi:MAG TPA: 16S rRNA (adenine(1518)-N(6)/adenine(1519)-N(6))-dimethyltransferase RsmA [Smithellaceae bacterium]|nr:16S rRNA (adenine(1518)-N(6)/adenine(1519)-N(6))-dimethyltransferase RsmA [Smithellaceae bacterium]HRY38159.1 16S rRNA (adenine(1518)-N(6)/adenine(1519)-N(6))-dimethyltransferase RsmA [Smithellaceae bacterium]